MELEEALANIADLLDETKIHQYKPYPWQIEFHGEGKTHPERMLIAANRVGKTYCGAAEAAFHATGLYPDWWEGKRFDKPTLGWCGGITNESLRDIVQKELLGGLGDMYGKGAIPKALLGRASPRQAGISGVVDKVTVKHVSGGTSEIVFKSYEQGWRKWQGTAPDYIWLDEEPDDMRIYTECRTRIITSKGSMWVTFTPLSGLTELVMHFREGHEGSYMKNVTWDDAPHLDKEQIEQALDAFPPHERDARSKGIPMMGEGRVFPIDENTIRCDPFQIPSYYMKVIGIDFGWDHPAATVLYAYDPDKDCVYIVDAHKERHMDALHHAEHIKRMGGGHNGKVPVAWPHDGLKTRGETGKGHQLIKTYKDHGLNLLSMSARHKNDKGGAQSREASIMDIYERMQTGRFKVFSNLNGWFEEFRNYHRKDGAIVDKMDDLISATFYAHMMRRFAVPDYVGGEEMPGAYL